MSATPSPPHVSALTPAQAGNATLLFASSFLFNLMLSVVAFFLFGGRELLSCRVTPGGDESTRRFERDVKERQEKSPAGRAPIAGGATSAATADVILTLVASTTGILGALIPLAVPFLETGAVGAVGLIIALSISSSVVDSSPFSTSGALTVANTPEAHREFVFKRLMQWGMSMVLIAPPLAWLIFVVPGWL